MSMDGSVSRRMMLGGSALPALLGTARAQETGIRITVDFSIYGPNSPFVLATDLGFFREAGVTATVDGSGGSGDAITRVANGSYDFGFADVSTLVEFCARNPQAAPKLVMPILDRPPPSVVAFKRSGVTRMADLIGRKVGTGRADASSRLFPAVLKHNNLDIAGVNRLAVDSRVRDPMLIRGEVDAVVGFDYTILFNLLGNGVALSDMNVIYYADNGFDFYGNGLIASRAIIERNPDLVRRVARASGRAWVAALRNPQASVEAIARRDALVPVPLETQRLAWTAEKHVLTPAVRASGLGVMDLQRLEAGIATVTEAFELPRKPAAAEIWDDRFLPAPDDRRI